MGIFGYMSLGDNNMIDLFILRPSVGGTDYAMRIGFFFVLFMDITSLLCNFFPAREQLMLIFKMDRSNKSYVISTGLLLGASVIICIVYPQIMFVISLAGGLFCSFVGWTIPYLCRIKMLEKKSWFSYPKGLYGLGLLFILFVTCISSLQSIAMFKF